MFHYLLQSFCLIIFLFLHVLFSCNYIVALILIFTLVSFCLLSLVTYSCVIGTCTNLGCNTVSEQAEGEQVESKKQGEFKELSGKYFKCTISQ